MLLIIKNFGAIKEARIDLSKKHYFFVGYNNTGKTYLAKLIYDIFSSEVQKDFTESVHNSFEIDKTECLTLTETMVQNILNDFASFLKTKAIPKALKTNGRANFIVSNLDISFEFKFEDVTEKKLSSKAMIGLSAENTEDNSIEIVTLLKKEGSLDVEIQENNEVFDKIPADFFQNHVKEIQKNFVKNSLPQSLLRLLLQNKEAPFFLPANRIFILENADELVTQENQKRKELLSQLIELAENKDENQEKINALLNRKPDSNHTVHISTLIEAISKLRANKNEDFITNGTGFYDDFLIKLSKIMGGSITVTESTAISKRRELFEFQTSGSEAAHSIDLFLASSSVNQLGTLFLYLKYWAKQSNNFLILDEPEENLHPVSQLRLLDLLLDFANQGNRLLLTTHSPLIGQMLNNYLTLGQLKNKAEVAEQLGFSDKQVNPENTGIYYFNGETVTETTISNYGAIFASFKAAEDNVSQINNYLSDLMFNQQNQ